MSGRRLIPALTTRLADKEAERARAHVERRIDELQRLPAASTVIIPDVALVGGVHTPIPHSLGRAPRMVAVSPVRGAISTGRIEEIRDGAHDRTKVVVLMAFGFSTVVTVDVELK